MTVLNVAFYAAVLFMELQLLCSVVKVFRVAYLEGTPKYDAYYLFLALVGMLVANTCWVTSLNVYMLPKEFSFLVRGHAQITYNFFQLFAIMFYGLYLARNITFKNNFVQKILMILLELVYVGYVMFLPMMLDGNVWMASSATSSAYDVAYGMGQIQKMASINNWLTTSLTVILLVFLALFVYASVKMARSEKHSKVFHDYVLFLLYGLTAFALNVMSMSIGITWVLFLALVVILAYRVFFYKSICESITKRKLTEEGLK